MHIDIVHVCDMIRQCRLSLRPFTRFLVVVHGCAFGLAGIQVFEDRAGQLDRDQRASNHRRLTVLEMDAFAIGAMSVMQLVLLHREGWVLDEVR